VSREVEILVVANNSRLEKTGIKIASDYARVIKVAENLGYSGAINRGVENARGELLVFCDDDVITTPGWLEGMETFHRQSPRVGATAAKLISPITGRIVDYGMAFTQFNAPHVFQDQLPSHPLTTIRRRVQAASSALMMIDKRLFQSLDGFSVPRQSHYDDLELCLKLNKHDEEIWVLGDVVCYHKSSYATTDQTQYKHGELKGDAKANFSRNFGQLISVDLHKYYVESAKSLPLDPFIRKREYVLLSLANVMDPSWYHVELAKYFNIGTIYDLPTYHRDADHLTLFQHVDSNFIAKASPFIYFVDRFISLANNAHWFTNRRTDADIIADRNGNIITAKSLVSRQEWSIAGSRSGSRYRPRSVSNALVSDQLDQAREIAANYENTAAGNDSIWTQFARMTNEIPELRAHRDYVEANNWGFGDRSFHMMWLLLLDKIKAERPRVDALEIGVYKGQILSLWHLIGRLLQVEVRSIGISPLRGSKASNPANTRVAQLQRVESYYPDRDYRDDVHQIFRDFGLDPSKLSLIRGLSQEARVRNRVARRRFDIVYIDGDHRWSFARRDIVNYQDLVRDAGFLVIDDAGCYLPGFLFWKGLPSVTKALSAVDRALFRNVFNVGPNRIYQKISSATDKED
jgi:GT2 family glycosyltransferase